MNAGLSRCRRQIGKDRMRLVSMTTTDARSCVVRWSADCDSNDGGSAKGGSAGRFRFLRRPSRSSWPRWQGQLPRRLCLRLMPALWRSVALRIACGSLRRPTLSAGRKFLFTAVPLHLPGHVVDLGLLYRHCNASKLN